MILAAHDRPGGVAGEGDERAGGKGEVHIAACYIVLCFLHFNPFPPNGTIWRHETFSFMISHPAMSLGDRLCVSRKGRAGGGGWVYPKGANSMAASGLRFEQPLVGAR